MVERGESASTYTVVVPADKAGHRLDRVLATALPALSRTRLKVLIEEGRVVRGDGRTLCDPATKVRADDVFQVSVPPPRATTIEAQAIPLNVVYEDDDLLVIDKPAGLVVHPAPGNPDRTLVNALLAHCGPGLAGIGGTARPGIVHRLDKDTSGLMVVAKSDRAHRELARQFATREIERAYLALVWGIPSPRAGEIAGNIGRSPRNRKKMAVVARGGKTALTRYKVLKTFAAAASLVECRLATGRTHQIRVHMAHAGHPVIGDPLYGSGARARLAQLPPELKARLGAFHTQALHAYLIGFQHPTDSRQLRFMSNFPPIFNVL